MFIWQQNLRCYIRPYLMGGNRIKFSVVVVVKVLPHENNRKLYKKVKNALNRLAKVHVFYTLFLCCHNFCYSSASREKSGS